MKRLISALILVILIVTGLSGQDVDLQLSVVSRPLDPELLADLGLSRAEIGNLQEVQEQFRLVRERTLVEMNLVKAQIAKQLYLNEEDGDVIDGLLQRAGELRLEQERAQVRAYRQIRNQLGEEAWTKLVRRIRIQERIRTRQETPEGMANRYENGSPNDSPSEGSSPSSQGSSGGSGRR